MNPDPTSTTFRVPLFPDLRKQPYTYGATCYYKGKIYFVGGFSTIVFSYFYSLDVNTNKLEDLGSIPNACSFNKVIPYNNKLYVLGGYPSTFGTKVSIFDLNTRVWTSGADMLTSLCCFGAVLVGSRIYQVGGRLSSGSATQNVCSYYDIKANTWTAIANLPAAVMRPELVYHDNKIYAIGGSTAGFSGVPVHNAVDYSSAISSTYIYNIATNGWASQIDHQKLIYGNPIIKDDRLYCIGCSIGSPPTISSSGSTWVFNMSTGAGNIISPSENAITNVTNTTMCVDRDHNIAYLISGYEVRTIDLNKLTPGLVPYNKFFGGKI